MRPPSVPARRHRAPAPAFLAGLALVVLLALAAAMAGRASAAVHVVDSVADRVDANGADGICATADGTCTLRAAVQQANESPGQDTVTVPAGVYALAIAPGGGTAADGDLEITGPLVVQGAGFGATFIDGSGLDRVFEITETAGNVTLAGLTVRNGATEEEGGAILSATSGSRPAPPRATAAASISSRARWTSPARRRSPGTRHAPAPASTPAANRPRLVSPAGSP
jgi:hypothetical protein